MIAIAVLDVNETLFSLDAVGAAFDELGLGEDRLQLWFARVLRDGFALAAMGDAVAFPDLADHHTRLLGDELDRAVADEDVERVVAAFDEVEAHGDVAAGLHRLREAGIRLVPFTNGSAPIVARFLERSGLDALVEAPRDVTGPGVWKPVAAAYRWICADLGTDPADAAMVAVHPWDVAGAMRIGMRGAWLDRGGTRWPSFLPDPDHTAAGMDGLAATLLHGFDGHGRG